MPIGRILGQCSTTTPLNACFFRGQPAWTVQVLRPSHSASQSAFQILWNQYLRVTSLKRQLFFLCCGILSCSPGWASSCPSPLLEDDNRIYHSWEDCEKQDWHGMDCSRGIDQSNGCHGTVLAWMSVQSMRLIYQGSRWPTQTVPYSIEWRLDFKRNRTTAKKPWVGSCPMEEKAACDCCSPSVLTTQHSMTMLKPFVQDSIPSLLEGISQLESNVLSIVGSLLQHVLIWFSPDWDSGRPDAQARLLSTNGYSE